jgi:hypothetical protein
VTYNISFTSFTGIDIFRNVHPLRFDGGKIDDTKLINFLKYYLFLFNFSKINIWILQFTKIIHHRPGSGRSELVVHGMDD